MLTTAQALVRTLWIGGPAAAGKTTISRLLARRHGLRWYSTDARMHAYEERARSEGLSISSEGPGEFDRKPMIYRDLRMLPEHPVIVVEGALLTPDIARPDQNALWLMPSEAEQHARLVRRHPDGVHHGYYYGWRLIDRMIAEHASMHVLRVDGQSIAQTLEVVESYFDPALKKGVTATSIADRRELCRAENRLISANSGRGIERNFVTKETVRTFACECGRKECSEFVDLAMAEAERLIAHPAPSILATGH